MTTVLHLIPMLSPGGGARAAVETAVMLGGDGYRHRMASLRVARPQAAARARESGIEVLDAPPRDELLAAISAADIVHLHYWNSPELTELLELELPPMRLLAWFHVAGSSPPQLVPAGVVAGADLARSTSPRSSGVLAGLPVIDPISDPERVRAVRRSSRPGFNVGYIGSVSYTKMNPRFAEASAAIRVPDLTVIVCGTGDAHRNLLLRASELGIADRFELVGQVEGIDRHLADFDVFGYPLRERAWWSSDLALKEAMHAGVPPVVLADGASELLVSGGVTGVVVPTIDDYPRAIEVLHEDPERRLQLGRAAAEHARSVWSREALTPVWARTYERLMAEPKAERVPLIEPVSAPRGARRLLRAIGGPTEAGLGGAEPEAIEADRRIAHGGPVVGYTDGGLVDHRRRYPDEYQLALWTALFLRNQGRTALAEAEFARARALGCPDTRLQAHLREAVPG